MAGWSFTKKFRDFSKPKEKLPTGSRDSESILSSSSSHTQVSTATSPSRDDQYHSQHSHRDLQQSVPSLVLPSVSTGHVVDSAAVEKTQTVEDRRQTVTPQNVNDELQPESARMRPSSSQSSTKTVVSTLSSQQNQGSNSMNQNEFLNPFKPGLMTIKIYNGSNFRIPFDVNYDKNIFTKLINCDSNRSNEEDLINKLNTLNLDDDDESRTLSPHISSELIPANVSIPPSIMRNALIYFTLEFDKSIVVIEAEAGTIANPSFNHVSNFDVTKTNNDLKFQVFLRLPPVLTPTNTVSSDSHQQDILIGSKNIDLKFEKIFNPIRLKNHETIKFDNEFPEYLQNSNGELIISIDFKPNQNKHLTIDDFDLLKVIGKGSFGKVMQVRKKDSKKIYALKAIRKSHIVSRSEVTHTLAERTVLAKVDNPFIVPLKFSFQSPEKLYFVLNFINGGELFYHLQREGKFELSRARFYTCELLSALECLHSLDVIYRDLKPENILLDYKGHIALCDFGLCKLNMKNQDKTTTFCGTPEYLAPELLLGHGYTKTVDWWTLGILLYEMLTGLPPYYDEDVPTMYRKILTSPLKFPDNFDKDAKDLLIKLLSRDPKTRLGNNGAAEIQRHPFFKMIDWKKLINKGYLPPFKPNVQDSVDTSNFDTEFTNEKPVDSVLNDYLSDSVQKQFGGWTYVGTEQLSDSVKKSA